MPQEGAPLGVEATLELSAATIDKGDPLRMKTTLRHRGVLPVRYTYSGQRVDYWISDERGSVWLWSQGKAFTSPLVYATLWPGDVETATVRWSNEVCTDDARGLRRNRLPTGHYVARALWVSDVESDDGDGYGSWWSNEVPFRIRPAKDD